MRGNTKNGEQPNHIVTTWNCEDRYSLGQSSGDENSNEIKAIPKLLDKISMMKNHSRINCSLTLVLLYQKKIVDQNRASFLNLYDEIEICAESANSCYKSAFQLRNQNIVDRSDLVLCCIEHDSGGAYQTVRYAQQQKCPVINVAKKV